MPKPSRKDNARSSSNATVEIVTFEDLFTFFDDSKQRVKEKRKMDVDFDVDVDVDDDADGSDDDDDHAGVRDPEGHFENTDDVSLSSRASFSTMSTMDDLPGAGRTLDTHFYQPAGRFVERLLMTIMLLLHLSPGGGVRIPSDIQSLTTGSDTSTITNNPGPGRIIDKYVYRILGRMLERCAGRIAMSSFLPAFTIYFRIEDLWHGVEIKEPCFICRNPNVASMSTSEKIKMAVSRIEEAPSGAFILSGVKEITRRMRWVNLKALLRMVN